MTTSNIQPNKAGQTGAVVALGAANFDETLAGSGTVIVDFWAPWCGPCRAFAPIYEAMARKRPDIVFAKVNVDEEQPLAARFGIRAIPTLVVFRNQAPVFSQPGALPAPALEAVINKVAAA
jgi:thioredoxin 1